MNDDVVFRFKRINLKNQLFAQQIKEMRFGVDIPQVIISELTLFYLSASLARSFAAFSLSSISSLQSTVSREWLESFGLPVKK